MPLLTAPVAQDWAEFFTVFMYGHELTGWVYDRRGNGVYWSLCFNCDRVVWAADWLTAQAVGAMTEERCEGGA